MYRTIIKTIFFLLFSVSAYAASPVIFYSDLTAGPKTGGENNNGVYVTIWGNNFGASQGGSTVTVGGGAVSLIKTWTNTEICFQLGASVSTGNIIVTVSSVASNGISFTVQSGNIYFVDVTKGTNGSGTFASPWNTLLSAYTTVSSGDTVYLRAGTITNGQYGVQSCGPRQFSIGDGKTNLSFVSYPNETFNFVGDGNGGGLRSLINSGCNGGSTNITIAKVSLNYTSCGSGCGDSPLDGTGTGWRVVGNNITSHNSNYGVIEVTANNVDIYGNEIHGNYNDSYANQTHDIYVDSTYGTVTNFDIGWNYLHGDYNQGWEISSYHAYTRTGLIHDNLIVGDAISSGPLKGILADGSDDSAPTSSIYTNSAKVYNNILVNLGKNNGGTDGVIETDCGTNYIYNNTIYQNGGNILGMLNFTAQSCGPSGGNQVIYLANNIIYSNGSSAYITDGNGNAPTWSMFTYIGKNIYYGNGNGPTQDTTAINSNPLLVSPTLNTSGDFHLQGTSPAIGVGYNTLSVVAKDYDGVTRVNPPSIGSYEPATCSSNGVSCSTGSTCCSSVCLAGVCSAPYTCGDGTITPPEVCDTNGPNLNGQTCVSQGYSGGSLGCLSGCLSFDYSSCYNITATNSNSLNGKCLLSGKGEF